MSSAQDVPIAGFPDVDPKGHTTHETRTIPAPGDEPASPTSTYSKDGPLAISDRLPIYMIDLSQPPAQRYAKPAEDFKEQLRDLTGLFSEVVAMIGLPMFLVKLLARLFLHRVYSKEQTEEIRGVAKVAGLDLYLAIAFNVLLDMFMGCTSGGVKVKEKDDVRMFHFRTLDWGMNPLRKVIVQLDFIERPGGPVIAQTITYVGFVGVLTGVRKDLSVSLNFRPYHNDDSSMATNIKFYGHLLLVLLGFRPSIAATLRDLILPSGKLTKYSVKPSSPSNVGPPLPSLADVENSLPSISSTAAYLIFCDGTTTKVLEKDRISAQVYSSTSFLTATNHDSSDERSPENSLSKRQQHAALGMTDLVAESQDRKACIASKWSKHSDRFLKKSPNASRDDVVVTLDTVKRWIEAEPIFNDETHYACIMDPKRGRIQWARKFEVPPPAEEQKSTIAGEGKNDASPAPVENDTTSQGLRDL